MNISEKNSIMTASFAQENNQDSSSYRGFVIQDTLRTSTDSANVQIPIHETEEVDSSVVVINEIVAPLIRNNEIIVRRREIDTVSVSHRPTAADMVFASPNHITSELYLSFPVQFVQKNNEMLSEKRERIEKNLKNGETLPATPFHNDWTIGIIIFSIILFSIVSSSVKTFFPDIARFFLFREIKEKENKSSELFYWKSVFLNVSSFLLISIFVYFAVSYMGATPAGLSEFKIWLFAVSAIVIALTFRHLTCKTIGLLSGATKIFNDYIITIYQTYRFAGFFLSIVMILFFYTPLITAKSCLITGCIMIALLYLIRIFRLFLLFINYKFSIFNFILYFCALEILPVLISIKYFSGLIQN